MKFEPGSFHIGVIDLFSVILPGAVVAYLVYLGREAVPIKGLIPVPEDEVEKWIFLAFASYFLGHLLFLAGSFLDDTLYDPVRKLIWRKSKDQAFCVADAIRREYITNDAAGEAVNTFQWAKARIMLQHPEAIHEVHRLEADSKFFRSLVVLLLVITIVSFAQQKWDGGIVFSATLLLSFWRYVEQRFKSTKRAYQLVITLENLPPQP